MISRLHVKYLLPNQHSQRWSKVALAQKKGGEGAPEENKLKTKKHTEESKKHKHKRRSVNEKHIYARRWKKCFAYIRRILTFL